MDGNQIKQPGTEQSRTFQAGGNGAGGTHGVTRVGGANGHDGPARRRSRKQWRRRLPLLVLLVLAAGGFGAWYALKGANAGADLSALQTAKVEKATLVETVSAQGTVTAQTGAEVKIGSQITGRIKHLYADVGSHVTAGQVIAQLDLPDIEAQLQQAQANLNQAITKLQQQEAGVGMQHSQNVDAVRAAADALQAAQAKRISAEAAARQQPQQTQTDIQRAAAALASARASQTQAERSYDLSINNAKAAVNQAQAAAANAVAAANRDDQLFKQGFIAAADVDLARSQAQEAQAQLDAARQNLSLTEAKAAADVVTARQQVAQSEAALTAARAETFQNSQRQADVANAQAASEQAAAQLASAQAGLTQDELKRQDVTQAAEAVKQAEAQVQYQQAQVDKTYIRTPISGTVLQLAAQQGETLAAGLSAPTLIIVADLNRLQVDAYVDETDIGKVHLGQEASVTVDAYPNQTFKGTVAKIASGSTQQQGVVTYDVTIHTTDPQHLLKPDMTASVSIVVGTHPDVLAVPNEAVKPGPNGSYVWVSPSGHKHPRGAGEPRQVLVTTGATDGANTEIISGLREGQTVIVAGWPPQGQGQGQHMQVTPFGVRPVGGRNSGGRGGGAGRGGRG